MVPVETDSYKMMIFTAQSGKPSVRLERSDGTFFHVHSLVDPEAEATFFADIPLWGDRLILAGTGLGYHLSTLLENIGRGKEILLIEYYPECAKYTAVNIEKLTGIKPIVITYDMADVDTHLGTFKRLGGSIQVIRHPSSMSVHTDFYHTMVKKATGSVHTKSDIHKSLMFTVGNFFVERELEHAASRSDLNCSLFPYKNMEDIVEYECLLQKVLSINKPAAVVTVNMLGVDHNGIFPFYTSQYGIPSIHWFVDDPRPILLTRKECISRDMIACTWEREYIPFLKKCGFGMVKYLPLATDHTKNPLPVAPSHSHSLGFIGSAMGKAFRAQITEKCVWKPEYEQIAYTIAQKVIDTGGTIDIDNELEVLFIEKKNVDSVTGNWIRSYILHTASMLKRYRYIAALLPLKIEVFGDATGWNELFGATITTHPDIDYTTQASTYYNRIGVNVNITSCQMPTAVNQRVFDVPYSGGFLLTDYQSDMNELFESNEFIAFESVDDCVEKASYYINHPEERRVVVNRAQDRIQKQHTYLHRIGTILALL